MNDKEASLFRRIRGELNEDERAKEYKTEGESKFYGHCHSASVAFYVLIGGKDSGYKLRKGIDDRNETHYWIESRDGSIIDLTAEQYLERRVCPPYNNAIRRGVSHRRSKAARRIIEKLK